MRLLARTAALLGLLALAACSASSADLARDEGAAEAHSDLAAGHVVLRVTDHPLSHYSVVDVATGLPTEDWSLHCGTGVDLDAYFARVDGYNAVVRAALERGEFTDRLLTTKLRTYAETDAAFRSGVPLTWSEQSPVCAVEGAPFRLELRPLPQHSMLIAHTVDTRTGDVRRFDCFEPLSGACSFAFADDGTTLLARRDDGTLFSWDLPSGHVVQELAPPTGR